MITFRHNGRLAEPDDAERDTPLVYALGGSAVGDMTPRLGCGREQCGACRVLVDGTPAYACTLPTSAVADRQVVRGPHRGFGVWCLVAALFPGGCGIATGHRFSSRRSSTRSGPSAGRLKRTLPGTDPVALRLVLQWAEVHRASSIRKRQPRGHHPRLQVLCHVGVRFALG